MKKYLFAFSAVALSFGMPYAADGVFTVSADQSETDAEVYLRSFIDLPKTFTGSYVTAAGDDKKSGISAEDSEGGDNHHTVEDETDAVEGTEPEKARKKKKVLKPEARDSDASSETKEETNEAAGEVDKSGMVSEGSAVDSVAAPD